MHRARPLYLRASRRKGKEFLLLVCERPAWSLGNRRCVGRAFLLRLTWHDDTVGRPVRATGGRGCSSAIIGMGFAQRWRVVRVVTGTRLRFAD